MIALGFGRKLESVTPFDFENGNTRIGIISPPSNLAFTSQIYIVLVHPRYYNNTMTSLEELENQCLPISKLKKYATEWVIKVLVIRRSLTKEYKNTNGEGIRWQLILVDEEGTKIQTTLFNKDVHAWNKSFQLNQSYYIISGKLNRPKPNFLSVHKELELAFMNNTEVVEDKSHFKTDQFSNGFITFDEAEKITNGSLFGKFHKMFIVVCILLTVKALTGEGRSIRREVIVTNER
uniref:Replication protein A 70 kDa DNA-binding subunit B/D first OB fold domain-containing protein n=1 Tax=Solanum lycopersicum TaxID=4081 RepID=A0A3Q7FGN4_SOLLC